MKEIINPYPGDDCFFCGVKNDIGLKLKFYITDTEPPELVTRLTPGAHLKGLGRILHGGIQAGLFDEIMGWTSHVLNRSMGVTTDLAVKFLAPAYVEQQLEVRCRIAGIQGNNVNLAASITDRSGRVCSKATGNYVLMDTEKFNAVVGEDLPETLFEERIQS